MKIPLIVPVESQVRELDAKILFAAAAAERGFTVTIGSRAAVHYAMPFLERGLYVAKSMRSLSDRMFDIASRLGHRIVAWDEESLVRFDSPEYYSWRLSAQAFRRIALLFTWGEDDAAMFRAYPEFPGTPLRVTGNPRVDLLRAEVRPYFDEAVAELRGRFGDFVLVNTNFAFVNGYVAALRLVDARPGEPVRPAPNARGLTLGFAEGMAAHQQTIFDGFRGMLPALAAAFPDKTIVLRPHPSEKTEPWREIAERHPNVHVSNEGNVVPWLIAARVLVHNGCTTAVEGAVIGTPSVAFQPTTADEYDYHLPNALSHRAPTPEAVVAAVGRVLRGERGPVAAAERRRVLDRHLASLDGPLACDRILDAIEESGLGDGGLRRPGLATYAGGFVRGNVRTVKKYFNRLRPGHRNSRAYHAHRFPGVTAAEIASRADRLRALLRRFDGIRVRPLSRHLFRIEK